MNKTTNLIERTWGAEAVWGLKLALFIKIILIINFMLASNLDNLGLIGPTNKIFSTVSTPLYTLSFVNFAIFPLSIMGPVGLLVMKSQKETSKKGQKLVYFLLWYLTLNLITVISIPAIAYPVH